MRRFLALLFCVLMTLPSLAQLERTLNKETSQSLADNATQLPIARASLRNLSAERSSGDASTVTTTARTTKPSNVIDSLAQSYPAQARAQARQLFNTLLEGYGKLEQQFSIPRGDVAGAIAAFLAGSYMAYNNADFPNAHFPPLVNQVRDALMRAPEFARASAAEKRELYEQMAILGKH